MHPEAVKAYREVLAMISNLQVESAHKLNIPIHKLSIFMPQSTAAYAKLSQLIEEKLEEEELPPKHPECPPLVAAREFAAETLVRPQRHPRYPQR